MDAPRKADVIAIAHSSSSVSYSKYSGTLEWKNAVFLWVNIQANADYPNKFYETGRRFSWFGGSKMNGETPLVKRLLRNKESDPILLIIRFKDESYSCLGNCLCVASIHIVYISNVLYFISCSCCA